MELKESNMADFLASLSETFLLFAVVLAGELISFTKVYYSEGNVLAFVH